MTVHNSSSLDTKSSNTQEPVPSTYRAVLLAKNWVPMNKAMSVYSVISFETESRQLERLMNCRTDAYFYRNKNTGNIRIGSNSCHLRFCPLCAKTRELRVRENTANWLRKTRYPKFLTLTLAHSEDDLSNQISRLYDCWKHLRRLIHFKSRAKGGIWFFQIKKSKQDGCWHPHLHCVLEGGYISQKILSKEWLRITGDSLIVDIRRIRSIDKASEYVARYASQPCYLPHLTDDEAVEMAYALKSRRICGTFGTARIARLTAKNEYDRNAWEFLGSWRLIVELKDCDKAAGAIFDAWRLSKPLASNCDINRYLDFLRGREPTPKQKRPDPQLYFDFYGSSK